MKNRHRSGSWLIARFSHFSFRFIFKVYGFIHSVLNGFWLGIMGEKSFDAVDEISYTRKNLYSEEEYNMSGLFDWEKVLIEKYFKSVRNLLLIAAGGGREIFGLSKKGVKLDSYECNPRLVESGNALLEKNGISARIKLLQRDKLPPEVREYDGIILGWGAYSHIRGSERRKHFINRLKPFLKEKAPLMISFVTRRKDTKHDKIIYSVSNFFRFFRRKYRTELGDRMNYNFFHFFSKQEIYSELQACKFKIVEFYDKEYGCAVAVKDLPE